MSGDLISRQAVIDAIDKWVKNMGVLIALPTSEVTPLFESIHELPSVNPQEPETGHWESFDLTYGRDIYKCSVCKCTTDVPTVLGIPMFKYCPNCGCRMAEPQESEVSDADSD